MEERGLYPPRMELEITEIPSIPVTITITFGGTLESKEETMMQIALPYSEGIMYNYYLIIYISVIFENLNDCHNYYVRVI